MIAVLAPLVNSYKRLVPGYEAPTYLTWGRTNRSALIRVPMVSPGKSIEGTRLEVRCPDPVLEHLPRLRRDDRGRARWGREGPGARRIRSRSRSSRWTRATIAAKSIKELPGTLGEALDELEKDDGHPRGAGRPRVRPLRRRQARRVGRVPDPGLRLGSRALPRAVLRSVTRPTGRAIGRGRS